MQFAAQRLYESRERGVVPAAGGGEIGVMKLDFAHADDSAGVGRSPFPTAF